MIKIATIAAALLMGTAATAMAQEISGNWSVNSANGACWASTGAEETEGNTNGRGAAIASIQNFPSENVRGSIAFTNGGVESSQHKAEVSVDGKKFPTLTYKEAAFVGSGKNEAELTDAMRRGRLLEVTWTSKDGEKVTDRFSLAGFSAAKNTIDQDCR